MFDLAADCIWLSGRSTPLLILDILLMNRIPDPLAPPPPRLAVRHKSGQCVKYGAESVTWNIHDRELKGFNAFLYIDSS